MVLRIFVGIVINMNKQEEYISINLYKFMWNSLCTFIRYWTYDSLVGSPRSSLGQKHFLDQFYWLYYHNNQCWLELDPCIHSLWYPFSSSLFLFSSSLFHPENTVSLAELGLTGKLICAGYAKSYRSWSTATHGRHVTGMSSSYCIYL